MKKPIHQVIALASVIVLACIPAASAAEPIRLRVTMTEFAYSQRLIEMPAGRPLTIDLTNVGVVDHDLVSEEASVLVRLRPGQAGQVRIGALRPGTYLIYCSIPTHRELGMTATLVVH